MVMYYIILFVVFILLFVFYALFSYRMNSLPVVEAGPIVGVKKTGSVRCDRKMVAPLKVQGNLLNDSEYRRFVVQGECMRKRGINPGDIVVVRLFDKTFSHDNVSQDDIVLIYLNDDRFKGYKIRVWDVKDSQAGLVKTFYYNGEEKQESSEPHKLKDIIGVVKYVKHCS